MVRSELTADDSLAAIRARSRFGIAIAAMIRMIATTMSNSINEKPRCFFISLSLSLSLRRSNFLVSISTASLYGVATKVRLWVDYILYVLLTIVSLAKRAMIA